MAEIIFDCPACKQPVQADDAWAGQQIDCPICGAPMIVPQSPAPSTTGHLDAKSLGKQLVAVPGENKLKAGLTQTPRSSTGGGPVFRNFQTEKPKGTKPAVKYAINGAVVVALLAGGWFAWPYVRPHLAFLNKTGEEPAATQTGATTKGVDPAAPAVEPAAPPPPKEVPMTPPTYTLDIAAAKISEGKVNGSISGTNFVPDVVRLDKVAGLYVLDLRQGPGATPDRGLRVYLRLDPTASPTGHTWTVSQEMKGTPVSRVVKVWKTNPKYAAQEKSFSTGFALKLEFGQYTESNTIPGKIYAALPDNEKSVVGGVFTAVSGPVGAPGTVVTPQAVPTPSAEASPEFQRRYGTRR
jgi:hypothetical protein